MKLKLLIPLSLCLILCFFPDSTNGQLMKKIKKKANAISNNLKKEDDTTSETSPEPVVKEESAETPQEQEPTIEKFIVDMSHEELRNFELQTFEGKLLSKKSIGRMTMGSSISLPENYKLYQALNAYKQVDKENYDVKQAYKFSFVFMTKEAVAKYRPVVGSNNVFEQKRAEEAFRSSGIHEALLAAQQSLPSPWEGYYVSSTKFSRDYNFEKEAFFLKLYEVGTGRTPHSVRFYYKVAPAEAEQRLNELTSNSFFIVRKPGRFDSGTIYQDKELTKKLVDYGPSDLTIMMKGVEIPFISNQLSVAELEKIAEVDNQDCAQSTNLRQDCDCRKPKMIVYAEQMIRKTLSPAVLIQDPILSGACANGKNVYYSINYSSVTFIEDNEQNKSSIEYQLRRSPDSYFGPVNACELVEQLKRGEGTAVFYSKEMNQFLDSQLSQFVECQSWN